MTLDQLLADPLIRRVMASDQVSEQDVRSVMMAARSRRGGLSGFPSLPSYAAGRAEGACAWSMACA